MLELLFRSRPAAGCWKQQLGNGGVHRGFVEEVVEYTDVAAAEELIDLEIEATVGKGKPQYNMYNVGSNSFRAQGSSAHD